MEPINIKPLPYGKDTAVKANLHGAVGYDYVNGNMFGTVAVFTEDNVLKETFNFKLGKNFTDTWVNDADILPAALEKLEIEKA